MTRLLAKTKQYLHTVFFFTVTIRSVDQQRKKSAKDVDVAKQPSTLGLIIIKSPDNLRSDT